MDKKTAKLLREHPTFYPEYEPAAELNAKLETLEEFASIDLFRRGRTGHHVIAVPDRRHPKGRKVAHFDSAADAAFVSALVNSWHAGRLQVKPMEIPTAGEKS